MEKLIITAAVTGSAATRKDNPNIPYSPEEIANEIVRSYEAGASIVHVHVRDPKTGAPSFELEYFREVRDRVRSRCDILLNFTTSSLNLKGDNVMEMRVSTMALGPDIAPLDIGSMNFRGRLFINPPEWGPYCAKAARDRKIKLELECFEVGHIHQCIDLINQGLLDPPYFFQICLGVKGGMDASIKSFLFMVDHLPAKDVVWSVFGLGRAQFPIAVLAMLHGGNIRVGLEDNLHLSKGVLAKSNAELVDKAVRLATELGRDIARPDDVRKILNIKKG
jgi:3-keto-5-aminohexanoate cleavage enzyme